MPAKSKQTRKPLSSSLLNISCLIGDAQEVLDSFAKADLQLEIVPELSRQAAHDLSRAKELLAGIRNELRKEKRSPNYLSSATEILEGIVEELHKVERLPKLGTPHRRNAH
jgi:protein involved in temperature-dependent protein secretion